MFELVAPMHVAILVIWGRQNLSTVALLLVLKEHVDLQLDRVVVGYVGVRHTWLGSRSRFDLADLAKRFVFCPELRFSPVQ